MCFQAEDGIRDLVRSRGLGDVYKRQVNTLGNCLATAVVGKWDNELTIPKKEDQWIEVDLSLIHI